MRRPVLILTSEHQAELARLAEAAGWPVVAATRLADADRLAASAAAAVVLDTRGAGAAALDATARISAAVDRDAALLVLVASEDVHRLDELRAAGATHFLVAPFADAAFVQALRFAAAGAERRGGERGADAPTGPALSGFLARDLERALAADEVEILFQPQVVVATGKIAGVEALMRWRHAEYGELGAEQLLDAADRAGLIRELSAHVHARALAEAAAWPVDLNGLRLSLNVTADDLATAGFAHSFIALVEWSGFAADRLTLEITERGLIADPALASAVLGELRAAGMRVAIDDFGAGYSSLAYLARLPLDYLKLDGMLVRDVAGSERDRLVLRAILRLADSLGLAVVAEGVETDAQREVLGREECALYQGYLCAPPLATAELARLVAGGS